MIKIKMNDKQAIRAVEKVVWDWKNMHSELNDAILHFEKTNPKAYKIVSEIADEEARLIEEANMTLTPLLHKLKKEVMKKKKGERAEF